MTTRKTTRILLGAGLEHAPSVRCALIAVLCVSMLLVGCASSQNVKDEKDPDVMRSASNDIKVTLNSGATIEVEKGRYVQVEEPSSFVYVHGRTLSAGQDEHREFAGRITPLAIETSTVGNTVLYYFKVSDTLTVRSMPGECIFVDSVAGSGLWVDGTITQAGTKFPFIGRIAPRDIKKIVFLKGNTTVTALLTLGGVLLVGFLAVGVAVTSSFGKGYLTGSH